MSLYRNSFRDSPLRQSQFCRCHMPTKFGCRQRLLPPPVVCESPDSAHPRFIGLKFTSMFLHSSGDRRECVQSCGKVSRPCRATDRRSRAGPRRFRGLRSKVCAGSGNRRTTGAQTDRPQNRICMHTTRSVAQMARGKLGQVSDPLRSAAFRVAEVEMHRVSWSPSPRNSEMRPRKLSGFLTPLFHPCVSLFVPASLEIDFVSVRHFAAHGRALIGY